LLVDCEGGRYDKARRCSGGNGDSSVSGGECSGRGTDVASEDQAINPELERFYAKRIGATTTEIKSSHVPFLSHPRDVAKVIEAAATAPTVRATQ
jgi:hypothetical protein